MKRSRGTGAGEVPATGQDAAAEAATTPPTGPEPASDTSFRRPSADDGDRDTTAAEPDTLFRRPVAGRDDGDPDGPAPFLESDEGERRPAPFLESEEGEHRPGPFVDSEEGEHRPGPFLRPEPGGHGPAPFLRPEPGGLDDAFAWPDRARAAGDDERAPAHEAEGEEDPPPAERTAPLPLDEPDPARPPGGAVLGEPAGVPVAAPVAEGPAGLDPAEAAARPPAGRRSRLRRRLRYLRRARELLLRDLGGLVYEVHRTGGGDLPAHAGLVAGKIERLVTLDAEAHGLEAVLAAPREQVALFEPGVGGTCDACGELYGSDARFCSHCGTATSGDLQAPAHAVAPSPAVEGAPTLAEPAPEPHPPMPEEPPQPAAPGAEAATSMLPAAGEQDTMSMPAPDREADEEAADDTRTRAFRGDDEAVGDEEDADARTRSPRDADDEPDDARTRSLRDADEEPDDARTRSLRDAEDEDADADEARTRALRPAGGQRPTDADAPPPAEPADDDDDTQGAPPPGEILRWRERRG